MEPVTTIAVLTYIATKMVDQFLAEQGYGTIKTFFFPKEKYSLHLASLLQEVITEHEKKYPYSQGNVLFPFYHSQILFDLLNQHVLFTSKISIEEMQLAFKANPNISPPKEKELTDFYQDFCFKVNNSDALKKLNFEENYKEKIFEIGDTIFEVRLLLESIDKKLSFPMDSKWLAKKAKGAIADLGKRYTPELNVMLDVADIFEGIGRTELFSQLVSERIDKLLINGNKLRLDSSLKPYLEEIKRYLDELLHLFEETNLTGNKKIQFEVFINILNRCSTKINEIEEYVEELRNTYNVEEFENKFMYSLRELRGFEYECSNLISFLDSTTIKLANNPYLLLEGEAGIGKSHLLADVVSTRLSDNSGTIFILGQQLVSDEPPWNQMFKLLQVNSTSSEFLGKLNLYGEESGKRVIIFIDAINEGKGNYFWTNFVNSFIDEIKSYEWLGLVLSIRSTYKKLTFTPEQITRNNFVEYRLVGFQNTEFDAVNMFFDNYDIERPVVPLLNPEFKNPLFLKVFCEGVNNRGLKQIPKGLKGITSILDFFIDSINLKLSSVSRYKYDESLNLVKRSINAMLKHKSDFEINVLPYSDAYLLIEETVKPYLNQKGFIDDLIQEGVLQKGPVWNKKNEGVDCVYLTYERFEDHLTVSYLLEGVTDIEYEFSNKGKFYEYFKNQRSLYLNLGLIEALAIQLPEQFDKELYDLLPEFKNDYSFIEAFVKSLVWRKVETIDHQEIKPYIEGSVFKYQGTYDFFFETIVSLSATIEHPYNSNFLHRVLKNQKMPDRDENWTTLLKYKYSEESSFRSLIDWAWSDYDKTHITNESLKLASITLIWFLTSSNRELRDCSTKALVNLLENRIEVLNELLEEFKNVDDPFVLERVYAVAYGCALRTKQVDSVKGLAKNIYEAVFNNEEVYPHILLRDYARGVIEYSKSLGHDLDIDISKTLPPYNSLWPTHISSKAELEAKYDNDRYSCLWNSTMESGDFARYTIGTNHNHSEWSGCRIGETPVNRKKMYKDFVNTLAKNKKELFDALDPIIVEDGGKKFKVGEVEINLNTAIGRKTEEELNISKTAFKKALEDEELKYYEENIEPYLNNNHNFVDSDSYFDTSIAQRLIFERVIDLGWCPEKHLSFDNSIGTGRGRRESYQERIGKKYQWIAYYEFMARLSDNFIRYSGYGSERKINPYIGSWDPYVRDIDPTILIKKTGVKKLSQVDNWWASTEAFDWDCSFDDWVGNHKVLERPEELIEVVDSNGDEWLVLQSYPSWKEPKKIGNEEWGYPRKEVWCHILSYLIKEDDHDEFVEWLEKQHFMGRWMPEASDRYQLFDREYYWSKAFKYFQSDDYGCSEWTDIHDNDSSEFIAKVSINSLSYHWEEEFDHSKEETLSFLKPSSLIVDKMNLIMGDNGTLNNEYGQKICFAAEAIYDTKPHLLIRKDEFIKFLEDNKLKVVWTLLGEKGVIGGNFSSNHSYARVEFSGSFCLKNGKATGTYNIY